MTITKELEATLQLAIAEAKRRHHEYVTLEHLLLALCADPAAAKILRALRRRLQRAHAGARGLLRRAARASSSRTATEPKQTPAFWRVAAARRDARPGVGQGQRSTAATCWSSLFRERDSHAVYLLEQQGVTPARRAPLRLPRHRPRIERTPKRGSSADAPTRTRSSTATRSDERRTIRSAAYTVEPRRARARRARSIR